VRCSSVDSSRLKRRPRGKRPDGSAQSAVGGFFATDAQFAAARDAGTAVAYSSYTMTRNCAVCTPYPCVPFQGQPISGSSSNSEGRSLIRCLEILADHSIALPGGVSIDP